MKLVGDDVVIQLHYTIRMAEAYLQCWNDVGVHLGCISEAHSTKDDILGHAALG